MQRSSSTLPLVALIVIAIVAACNIPNSAWATADEHDEDQCP